jgi:hypothetical protein
MSNILNEITRSIRMSDKEERIRYAIGSAAAAAAIFAPLNYKWKGILTAVAAESILTGAYRISPLRRVLHS